MNNASNDSNRERSTAGTTPEDLEIALRELNKKALKLVRPGIDPQDPRQRWVALHGTIQGILTEEIVTQMVKIQDVHERNRRVKELALSVFKLIRQHLSPSWSIDEPHRGRPAKYAERDRQIYEMRQKGMSRGQIARELRQQGWLKSLQRATDGKNDCSG